MGAPFIQLRRSSNQRPLNSTYRPQPSGCSLHRIRTIVGREEASRNYLRSLKENRLCDSCKRLPSAFSQRSSLASIEADGCWKAPQEQTAEKSANPLSWQLLS